MNTHSNDASLEIYHRIYRLMQKKVDALHIAAMVELPLKTVQNMMLRLNTLQSQNKPLDSAAVLPPGKDSPTDSATDIYFKVSMLTKNKYSIFKITGLITDKTKPAIEIEFGKILSRPIKALALHVANVDNINLSGSELLREFRKQCDKNGVFVAILDPSAPLEKILESFGLEKTFPIFGTEAAFEKAALSQPQQR